MDRPKTLGTLKWKKWEGHPNESSLIALELMSAPVATDWPSFKDAVMDKILLRYHYYGLGTRLYHLNRTFHRLHAKLSFRVKDAVSELSEEDVIAMEYWKNNLILFPKDAWTKFILKVLNDDTGRVDASGAPVDPVKDMLDRSLTK